MPTRDEIIRAHDTLVSILSGDVPCEFGDDEQKLVITAGLDALCWVLGHEHNPQFEQNLDMIRGKLKEAGYVQTGPFPEGVRN